MLKAASDAGVTRCYTHAILDGRDVPPKSAESSLKKLTQLSEQLQCGHVVSMTGRYYAMDRDKRWERTEKAYDLLTAGLASYQANDAMEGLQAAYQRGESDEFVKQCEEAGITVLAPPSSVMEKSHNLKIWHHNHAVSLFQLKPEDW